VIHDVGWMKGAYHKRLFISHVDILRISRVDRKFKSELIYLKTRWDKLSWDKNILSNKITAGRKRLV
jgi:hypothetical protein